jgi:hypothetical protein
MKAALQTAGERIAIDCSVAWVAELIEEAAAGELGRHVDGPATLAVHVEPTGRPFASAGWESLTRGALRHEGSVLMEDVCSSGFDVLVDGGSEAPVFTFRWRPSTRGLAASRLLRSRFILLARAVLIQYPTLWRASLRGRSPLHASVCTAGELQPMLAGPSGVGKSTLLSLELAAGGHAIGDNLCVSDGTTAWGLVEPLRIEGGAGRSMPHNRRERPLDGRATAMIPDMLVSLSRGDAESATVIPCEPAAAARSLVTGTYMAGELRRYWAFAATLSAGTGFGPAHAPVERIAGILASRLPGVTVVLPRRSGVRLNELLTRTGAIA